MNSSNYFYSPIVICWVTFMARRPNREMLTETSIFGPSSDGFQSVHGFSLENDLVPHSDHEAVKINIHVHKNCEDTPIGSLNVSNP